MLAGARIPAYGRNRSDRALLPRRAGSRLRSLALRLLAGPLFLFAALLAGAAGARAQGPESTRLASCKLAEGDTLPTLEERRQRLEQELARAPGRKGQEQLLEVIFKIDCVKGAPPLPVIGPLRRSVAPAPAAKPSSSVIEVVTYYATNRKPTGKVEPASAYGPETEIALNYGRAVVSIPPTHTPGNLELPSLWKLERDADPSKHFVLKSIAPLRGDAARAEMADKLQAMGSRSLLLFVHGYNTSFSEAALRTAQMAHDLRFPGMAFFFSWPSAGQILSYWQDEETALISEGVFETLLEELSQLPVTDIYVVAHSMGSRIVTSALRTRVDKKRDTQKLRELLLAAPDINAELFSKVIAPKLAEMQGMRTTVYASSGDLALKASKIVHGFRRVGDTVGEIFIYPGFETIDASNASTMARAYGHSYLMDSSSVLRDIQAIVERKIAASQRGLRAMGVSPNQYWFLQ